MRNSLAFVIVLAAACGKDPGTTGGPDGNTGSNTDASAAFEIKSPDILLPAGQEFTKCFYFHTSNTSTVAINKWISDMTPGSHHLILLLNPNGSQPADGTIEDNCDLFAGATSLSTLPSWTFAAASAHVEEDLPADDGAGKPLAQNIPANTAGYVQMHYLNATDNDLMVHIDVKAYALPASTPYTQTDAYITYVQGFSVPPGTSTVTGSCPVDSSMKFWQMTSHTHKQGTEVKVTDGSSMIYDSTDWEHPMVKEWASNPFYTFTSNSLSWACSYNNPGSTTIKEGQSAATNEMCMANEYYFPATGPKFNVVIGGSGGTCMSFP